MDRGCGDSIFNEDNSCKAFLPDSVAMLYFNSGSLVGVRPLRGATPSKCGTSRTSAISASSIWMPVAEPRPYVSLLTSFVSQSHHWIDLHCPPRRNVIRQHRYPGKKQSHRDERSRVGRGHRKQQTRENPHRPNGTN